MVIKGTSKREKEEGLQKRRERIESILMKDRREKRRGEKGVREEEEREAEEGEKMV